SLLGSSDGEGLVAPRVPVDGVVGVLPEVGAELVAQPLLACAHEPGLPDSRRRPRVRRDRRTGRRRTIALEGESEKTLAGRERVPARSCTICTGHLRLPYSRCGLRHNGRPLAGGRYTAAATTGRADAPGT